MDKLMELYNMEEAPMLVMIQSGEHAGFEYFIAWFKAHPNAYIRIPKDHPYYQKDYHEIDDKELVHCGFTFSGEDVGRRYGMPEGWYLGWDYGHCMDFLNFPDCKLDGFKWSVKDIEEEIKEVIDKIIKEAK